MDAMPGYRTFFREWREFHNLTLRDLADRMRDGHGNQIISYASLGRIERGLQPYSQPVVEAIARALGVNPGLLIYSPPLTGLARIAELSASLNDRDRRAFIAIGIATAEAIRAARDGS